MEVLTNGFGITRLVNRRGWYWPFTAAFSDLGDLGEEGREYARELAETQLEQAQFRPYTVTSATGGTFTADPEGGYRLALDGPEAQIQQQLMARAGRMFGRLLALVN